MLDTPVGVLVQKMAPQFASMLPADYARQPLRQVMKEANFIVKSMITSKIGPYLPPGVTMADLDKAVNQPAPPPEKPAEVAKPAVTAPAPQVAAPVAGAPASKGSTTLPQPAIPPPKPAVAAPPPVAGAPPAAAPAAPAPAPAAAAPTTPAGPALMPQARPTAAGPRPAAAEPSASVPYTGGVVGGKSTKGVNQALVDEINRVGSTYEPYGVRITSGYREGGGVNKRSQHGHGEAIDVELFDRKTGQALPNYQNSKSAPAYQAFAEAVYNDAQKNNPDLASKLRWGGYFGGQRGKYGAFDLMHFDTAGRIGMAGGSWGRGWTPEMQKYWGVQNAIPATGAATAAAPAAGPPAAAAHGDVPDTGRYYPKGTDQGTIASIGALASRLGVSPAAIAGVIKTESNWDPRAGTGSYHGLTQMGPATFAEAGGKLNGLTYDEYLKASPDKQVDTYGAWLDHYGFSDKFKGARIDLATMTPAQQAAYLQAFQFAPGNTSWIGGDDRTPVTLHKQADALGSTSLADMTRYYENLLSTEKGDPVTASAGGTTETPAATPATPDITPTADAGHHGPGGGMGGFGEALQSMASGMYGGAKGGGAQTASGPTTVPMAQLPRPSGPISMVDPKMAEMQRQQLAMALQRLNSGKLV